MKKLLLLGSLITATAMQAQETGKTTYYWPNERVTEITDGTQYFIYNTAFDSNSSPNDRGSFLYANGANDFGTLDPKQYANVFTTNNVNYLFHIYKKADAEHVYQIKNAADSWINFTGRTSNDAVDFYIKPWATSDATKGNLQAKMDDGSLNSDLDNAKVWTVTNNASNTTAWNGNGSFTTWGTAHPYAFYTVASKEVSNQAASSFQEKTNRTGLISDVAFSLQKAYGLVKDGNKYYSNYPETDPNENSSYANLIDGNDNSIFHSSWSASGSDTDPKHYLRAELETPQSSFYLITKRRTSNNYNRPTSILVEGSNEENGNYTAITTLEGLSTISDEYFYFSDKISSTEAYKYIRFTPNGMSNAGGATRFFTYSEFYLIEANSETDAEIDKIRTFYNNNRNISVKDENFEANAQIGYADVKEVQETLKLALNKADAQALLKANEGNHAADPALGQYPTEAYNTLKAKIEEAGITSNDIAEAIKTFQFSINAPVFTINGAFNGGYNTVGKSIYYKEGDNSNPLWWDKATNKYDKTMLWKFAGLTSTTPEFGVTYSAMNMASDVYLWNVENMQITQTDPANEEGQVLIKSEGYANPLHADTHGYIVRWGTFTPNSASAWTITYVGESYDIEKIDDEQLAAYAALKTLVAECEPFAGKIGTGLNQFTCNGHDFEAALATAKNIAAQDIYQNNEIDAKSALAELQAAKAALTINQPESGKYYRIKSVSSNKYIASNGAAGSKQKIQEDGTDANTVFYLSADGHLTGSNLLNMTNAASTGTALGDTYAFQIHTQGYYLIKPSSSNPLYDNSAANGTLDYWGSNPDKEAKCAWILEEVNDEAQQPKLSKTMTADYATLAAPVALNIPEGVKAYTVTVDVDKESAVLEEVAEVIPAGVAVVLKKEGSESNFDFTFAAEGATANSNNLVGVYTSTAIAADVNAYILSNGNSGIGFYQMNAEDRTLGANKAYLALPTSVSHIRSITIGGPTTGIEDTVAEETQAEEYYDLQGRHVMNPTKGIYVTKSGKKVVFNK